MDKLIQRIIKFRDDRNWSQFHTPENLSKSIVIEASELLEHYQWTNNAEIDEVKDELADVLIYCLMLAETLDLDILDIMSKKIDKNELKYPVDKAYGVSTKYNKL